MEEPKISKRNKGFYFHKHPYGISTPEARAQAMKDISGECLKNYIYCEKVLLDFIKNERDHIEEIKQTFLIQTRKNKYSVHKNY